MRRAVRPRGSVAAEARPARRIRRARIDRALRPSELGYKGGLLGNLFRVTNKAEVGDLQRKSRPAASLTQPPPGYQTPSAAHVYGHHAQARSRRSR